MSSKYKYITLGLMLLSSLHGWSQFSFGSPAITTPATNSVSLCDAAPTGFFEVNWSADAALTGAHIDVVLPTGTSYVLGSVSDQNLTGAPPNFSMAASLSGQTLLFTPSISGTPTGVLPQGAKGTLRFSLSYDCSLLSSLSSPFTIEVDLVSDQGTAVAQSPAINSSAALPQLNLVALPTTTISDADLDGTSYDRSFSIVQSGQGAEVSSFTLCLSYGSNIDASSQMLAGVALSFPAAGGCLTIDEATYPSLPWPMSQDESWVYTESVIGEGCGSLSSSVDLSLECGSAACQDVARLPLPFETSDSPPGMEAISSSMVFNTPNCIFDGAVVNFEYEATGKVYKPKFRVVAGWSRMYIVPGSIEADFGTGTFSPVTDFDYFNEAVRCSGENSVSYFYSPDAIIDASAGPKRIRVRYEINACCGPPPSVDTRLHDSFYGAVAEVYFTNKCKSNYRSARIDIQSKYGGLNATATIPEYLDGGEQKTVQIDIDNLNLLVGKITQSDICIDIQLGSGLSINIANGMRWNYDTPLHQAAIQDLGGGHYLACFDSQARLGRLSEMKFDLLYDCATTGAATCGTEASVEIDVGIRMKSGICSSPIGDCLLVYRSFSSTTTLGESCCLAACDGAYNLGGTIERQCFGAPDKDFDGCPDADGILEHPELRLDRGIKGDEMELVSRAKVLTTSIGSTFDYATLSIDWPEATSVLPQGEVRVVDGTTGQIYQTNGIILNELSPMNTAIELNSTSLAGQGSFPANFKFSTGDSIDFAMHFYIPNNPGCDVTQVYIDTEWFLSNQANAVGINRLSCNETVPVSYGNVGWTNVLKQSGAELLECGGVRISIETEFCTGAGVYGANPFPAELRSYSSPSELRFDLPEGMVLDSVILYRKDDFGNRPNRYPNQTADISAFASIVGDDIFVDLNGFYQGCQNEAAPVGGHRDRYYFYFSGACQSAELMPSMSAVFDFESCSGILPPEQLRIDTGYTYSIITEAPSLTFRSTAADIQPITNVASWDIEVQENNGGLAPNTWAVLRNLAGDIMPIGIEIGGIRVPVNNGIYELGDVAQGALVNAKVLANFFTCTSDTLEMIIGRSCTGYPTSVADALNDQKNCGSEVLKLSLQPQTAQIQMSVVEEPASPVNACTPLSYELELLNTANATVYESFIEVTLPLSGGMAIVPGSVVASFPSVTNPALSDFTVDLGAPSSITLSAAGEVYRFDFEGKSADFNAAASLGWDGLPAADADRRRIGVRLEMETTCDYTRTDFLRFTAGGTAPCGVEVRSLERATQPVTLLETAAPYEAELQLAGSIPINLCTSTSELTLAGSITFDGITDGTDTLYIDLPAHFSFAGFDAANLGSFATPILRENSIAGGFTQQTIAVEVEAGATANQSLNFDLRFQLNLDQLSCPLSDSIYLTSVRDVSYTCGAQTCGTAVINGELEDPVYVPLLFDDLVLSPFDVTYACGESEATISNLEITNQGSQETEDNLIFNFYIDSDGDGLPDANSTPIETISLAQNIALGATEQLVFPPLNLNGNQACQLLIELEMCGCANTYSAASGVGRPVGMLSQNLMTCPSTPVEIGCDSDPSAMYSWLAIGNDQGSTLSSTTAAQPQLTLPLTLASGSTVTYLRTTSFTAGCSFQDTVFVTVQDLIETQGDTVFVCATERGNMTGPRGMLNYQWSPSVGLADPTDPNTEVTPANVPKTYVLSYNTPEGCPAEFTQVVERINCVDLELSLSLRQNPTVIGDPFAYTLTLRNAGIGAASGVVVHSDLPASLIYVSDAGAGSFDPLSAEWKIPSLAAGDSVVLDLDYLTTEGGTLFHLAEVIASDQPEDDSTPNNRDLSEDDIALLCASLDVELDCFSESSTLNAPIGLDTYQWYQDGAAISGATFPSYSVSETGNYSIGIEGAAASCEVEVQFPTCVTLGDYVWFDANKNGLQDATDVPLEDLRILLLKADGQTLVDETRSDIDGAYLFENVPTGDYIIQADINSIPDGEYYRFIAQGTNGTTDSDVNENGFTTLFQTSDDGRTDLDIGVTFEVALVVVNEMTGYSNLENGNIAVHMRIGARNVGTVPLQDLSLEADFASLFGAGYVGIYDTPQAFMDGGFGNHQEVAIHADFDGGFGNPQLLRGDAFSPGGFGNDQTLNVYVSAEINPYTAVFPLHAQIFGSGSYQSPNGRIASVVAVDDSDSGADFYTTNPGAPGDQGSADDPTPIFCTDLDMKVIENAAKACAGSPVKLEASVSDSLLSYTWRAVQSQAEIAQGSPTYLNGLEDDLAVQVIAVNLDTLRCVYNLVAASTVGAQLPPTLITPNSDGYNDVFRMDCIEEHGGVKFTVFNRWGDQVYHSDDYSNDWDGTSQGQKLPVGTYFYLLEVSELNSTPYKGYISIER